MATIIDLVRQDFEKIYTSILNNPKVNIDFEDLLDTNSKSITNLLTNLTGKDGVILEERNCLIEFLSLMERSEDACGEYDEEIEQEFIEYIEKYPNVKSFEFFLIRYQSEFFNDEGIAPDVRVNFYRNVFENYPHLVNLDDFSEESQLLLPILLSDDPPVFYFDIFRKALDTFPHKAILKFVLSRLYEKSNLEKSIEYCLQFLGQIESDRTYDSVENIYIYSGDSITIENHVVAMYTLAELFYINSEYEYSLDYCDKLLEHYESHKEAEYDFSMTFFEPMIIRCRIHMKQNNVDAFRKDFEQIRRTFEEEDMNTDEYHDLLDFANDLKM
ncbi:MAG: hypothetical protein ABFS32_08190 [Bacteroidota bacterium]